MRLIPTPAIAVACVAIGCCTVAAAKEAPFVTYHSSPKVDAANPAASGCIVGRIGRGIRAKAMTRLNFSLWLHPTGAPGKSFGVSFDDNRSDLPSEAVPFAICVPVGRYELSGFTMEFSNSRHSLEVKRQPTLEVHAGTLAYLGDFTAYVLNEDDDCEDPREAYLHSTFRHVAVRDRKEQAAASIQALGQAGGRVLVSAVPDLTGLEPVIFACP